MSSSSSAAPAPSSLDALSPFELDSLNAVAMAGIAADVESQPLVGALQPAAELRTIFAGNVPVLDKLPALETRVRAFRSVRGDGHCFPRALLVRLAEIYVKSGVVLPEARRAAEAANSHATFSPLQDHYESLLERVASAPELLIAAAPGVYVKDDVEEYFFAGDGDAIRRASGSPAAQGVAPKAFEPLNGGLLPFLLSLGEPDANVDSNVFDFLGGFDDTTSSGVLTAIRLISSLEMLSKPDAYSGFLTETTIEKFVASSEANENATVEDVQVKAFAAALEIQVRLEYLDASASVRNRVDIPSGDAAAGTPVVDLLYRPGHYDIAYPIENQN